MKRGSHSPIILVALLILTLLPTVVIDCGALSRSPVLSQSSYDTDYLVITSESMIEEVQPLAQWKTQRGLFATILTTEGIEMQ